MRILSFLLFTLLYSCLCAQYNPPLQLPENLLKKFPQLSQSPGRNIVLIYDINSEAMAQAMYNGAKFLAGETPLHYIPVFVNSITDQKTSLEFENSLPVQTIRSLEESDYTSYSNGLKTYPVFAVYNEANTLCGFAQNVEDLVKIDCLNSLNDGRYLRLKILTEDKKKKVTPYANKQVYVLNGAKTQTLSVLNTNMYGDFEYKVTDTLQDYVLKVPEKMDNVNFVVLSTQAGREIGKFDRTEDGFEYRLLQVELMKLPDLSPEDEDVEMKVTAMKKDDGKEFTITENLFYELGKSEILPVSKDLLDKLILVLKANPSFKLVVISHTDSQGDDEANMKLSENRSKAVIDYFVSKGIDRKILKGVGKGETEIRNRCINGVECSDKEHEYNRRTEFRFIKG